MANVHIFYDPETKNLTAGSGGKLLGGASEVTITKAGICIRHYDGSVLFGDGVLAPGKAKADVSEESGENEQPPEKARAGEDKVAADICHFPERRRGHRD